MSSADPDSEIELGDPRRHVWLLIIGLVLLVGVGITVYRARTAPVVTANEAGRRQIEQAGVDPSRELPYEHRFLFPAESQATIAAAGRMPTGQPDTRSVATELFQALASTISPFRSSGVATGAPSRIARTSNCRAGGSCTRFRPNERHRHSPRPRTP